MGYGDKLMAIGDAWVQHQADPKRRRVAIGNGVTVDASDLNLTYGMSDFLAPIEAVEAGEDVTWVHSYPGQRPYIDYAAMQRALELRGVRISKPKKLVSRLGRYLYNLDYRPNPAPIRLAPEEQEIADAWIAKPPFIIIEPSIKGNAPPSKQWPVTRYFEVAHRLRPDVEVFQFCPADASPMTGVTPIYTASFRQTLPYLKAAALYIGPEGGLHHAAAAVGTRAVVIYGGFTSPLITGYPPLHVNLTGDNEGYACGTRYGMCPHCVTALSSITPDAVLNHARQQLEAARG